VKASTPWTAIRRGVEVLLKRYGRMVMEDNSEFERYSFTLKRIDKWWYDKANAEQNVRNAEQNVVQI
jgi:hypothetical protein